MQKRNSRDSPLRTVLLLTKLPNQGLQTKILPFTKGIPCYKTSILLPHLPHKKENIDFLKESLSPLPAPAVTS